MKVLKKKVRKELLLGSRNFGCAGQNKCGCQGINEKP